MLSGRSMKARGISASEPNPSLTPWLRQHFLIVDSDARTMSAKLLNIPLELLDIFTAGYPCQGYSAQGLQAGASDARSRWVKVALDGIASTYGPKCILLENVGPWIGYWKSKLVPLLMAAGYVCSCFLMDSRHCVPQHRERLYCVAVLARLWPSHRGGFSSLFTQLAAETPAFAHVRPMALTQILTTSKLQWQSLHNVRATANKNPDSVFSRNLVKTVDRATHLFNAKDISVQYVFTDMGASSSFFCCMPNASLCITKARAGASRLWIVDRQFRMALLTVEALGQLQGFDLAAIGSMQECMSDHQLRQGLGNAMTRPILSEIFARLLPLLVCH